LYENAIWIKKPKEVKKVCRKTNKSNSKLTEKTSNSSICNNLRKLPNKKKFSLNYSKSKNADLRKEGIIKSTKNKPKITKSTSRKVLAQTTVLKKKNSEITFGINLNNTIDCIKVPKKARNV